MEDTVVKVEDLIRWSHTFVPDYNQMADDANACKSPFPFNQTINDKIAYWNGDLTSLNAHAIVCCNNESLSDNDPLTIGTINRAGPELREELTNEIKMCRTGEAKMTKGYRLPARYVIHTVGPRYNIKYKTAAENALFNSYRNTLLILRERNLLTLGLRCIHTNRRGYPSAEGAHIALRTVRRFLDKYGDSIDLIVIVVTGLDREAYNSLLPLYFPRSPQEEIYAAHRLPVDIGNEDGEPVIAERKIRISANPAKDGKEEDGSEVEEEEDCDEEERREILGTSVPIGEHAFSKMEADVDKQRILRSKSSVIGTQSEEERKLIYDRFLKRAMNENFSDLSNMRFLYQSGFDRNNIPVVLFIARNFPAHSLTTDKALLYFVRQLDQVVNGKYIIVYIHTLAESSSHPSADCLKRLFQVLDSRYINNLDSLYMLHAGIWSKLSFWWFSTFNSPDIKSKVHYLPGVEYLFARIPPDQVDLPNFVMEHDYQTNGIRYYSSVDDEL